MSESVSGLMTQQGFVADAPARWAQIRKGWVGKRCTVTIEKETKHKTPGQLAFFFGAVVAEWSEHTGYEKDEMYLELWRSFMPMVQLTSKLDGQLLLERPRISECSSEQMSTFISRCIKEGNLMGITFPDPDTWRG